MKSSIQRFDVDSDHSLSDKSSDEQPSPAFTKYSKKYVVKSGRDWGLNSDSDGEEDVRKLKWESRGSKEGLKTVGFTSARSSWQKAQPVRSNEVCRS